MECIKNCTSHSTNFSQKVLRLAFVSLLKDNHYVIIKRIFQVFRAELESWEVASLNKFFNNMIGKDIALLLVLNNKIKCKALDVLMPLVTYLGGLTFMTAFCALTTLYPDRYVHKLGVKSSVALIISFSVASIVKYSVSRMRPFDKVENLNINKIGIDAYSFPSGHTTAAFALAIMISHFIPALSTLVIFLASAVGFSRMYLGVHYPSDVFVGVALGSFTSILVFNLML